MESKGQHDRVEQNAHPRNHDVRIGQDPKHELAMDTFAARKPRGAGVASAASASTATMHRCFGRRLEIE